VRNKQKLAERDLSTWMKFSYICLGFQPKFIWWQVVLIARSTVIAFIGSFFKTVQIQLTLYALTVASAFSAQAVFSPYESTSLNRFELLCISLTCLLFIGSNLLTVPQVPGTGKEFVSTTVAIIVILFSVVNLVNFSKAYCKKKTKKIKRFVTRRIKKGPPEEDSDSDEDLKSLHHRLSVVAGLLDCKTAKTVGELAGKDNNVSRSQSRTSGSQPSSRKSGEMLFSISPHAGTLAKSKLRASTIKKAGVPRAIRASSPSPVIHQFTCPDTPKLPSPIVKETTTPPGLVSVGDASTSFRPPSDLAPRPSDFAPQPSDSGLLPQAPLPSRKNSRAPPPPPQPSDFAPQPSDSGPPPQGSSPPAIPIRRAVPRIPPPTE